MATLAQKAAVVLLALVAASFGLFLTYLTLVHIEATELMWFVFVIYIPMILLFTGLSRAISWK